MQIALRLRALAALAENMGSVPSTYTWLSIVTAVSRDLMPPSGSTACTWYISRQAKHSDTTPLLQLQ